MHWHGSSAEAELNLKNAGASTEANGPLQTGVAYALQRGAARIVTFDSDGQHSLEDAESMLEVLNTTDSDVVLGSRFRGKALRMPLMRRVVLKLRRGADLMIYLMALVLMILSSG